MRASTILTLVLAGAPWLFADDPTAFPEPPLPEPIAASPAPSPASEGGRVLGLIPDNKIVPSTGASEEPLTVGGKFMLATKDTIDPFTFVLAGFYSGVAQWQNDYPTYGQGGSGYGKRFGAAYADQAIGNYFTEAIVPAVMHHDPRYFRRGVGTKWARFHYALTRTVITRTDRGRAAFNYSEWVGNGIAAGLSTIYYPAAERTAGEVGEKLAIQIASDSAFNVLLEFWPDMKRAVFRR